MAEAKKGLVVGEKLNISKALTDQGLPGLTTVCVGLGWDINPGMGGTFDLDACAVAAKGDGTAKIKDIVYFNELKNPSGSINHQGDNLNGAGEGDDEVIDLDFTKMEEDIDTVSIYAFIYQGKEKNQNFGMVDNAFVRVFDKVSGTELGKLDLSFDGGIGTCVRFGKFMRRGTEWYFSAEKVELEGGIAEIGTAHGV